jgi:hypothetical protein
LVITLFQGILNAFKYKLAFVSIILITCFAFTIRQLLLAKILSDSGYFAKSLPTEQAAL